MEWGSVRGDLGAYIVQVAQIDGEAVVKLAGLRNGSGVFAPRMGVESLETFDKV
jgi:hypothetical protein